MDHSNDTPYPIIINNVKGDIEKSDYLYHSIRIKGNDGNFFFQCHRYQQQDKNSALRRFTVEKAQAYPTMIWQWEYIVYGKANK